MVNDRAILLTLLISSFLHSIFLCAPFSGITALQKQKPKDITLRVNFKEIPFLPKVDKLGQEKKLKEQKEKLFFSKPAFRLEPKIKPVKNAQSLKKTEAGELTQKAMSNKNEIIKKKAEIPQEKIEILTPDTEAMFRYQDMVKRRIQEVRYYPRWAKKQGYEGIVYLEFVILSNGSMQEVRIKRSSGYKILDEEALDTVKRAEPFEPFPQGLNTPKVQIDVSVVFQLD